MGCSTSQSAKVVSAATKENGMNEQTEGDRKYRNCCYILSILGRVPRFWNISFQV